MEKIDMPLMKPVPIKTKGKPFYIRIWLWLFGSRKWEISENWEFALTNGYIVIIPKGFIFDGASIPRSLWWLLSPTGILFIPGLAHDFGYRHRYVLMIPSDRSRLPFKFGLNFRRGQWDSMFKEVSVHVNGMLVVSWISWAALRVFGQAAWKKNRQLNATEILIKEK